MFLKIILGQDFDAGLDVVTVLAFSAGLKNELGKARCLARQKLV